MHSPSSPVHHESSFLRIKSPKISHCDLRDSLTVSFLCHIRRGGGHEHTHISIAHCFLDLELLQKKDVKAVDALYLVPAPQTPWLILRRRIRMPKDSTTSTISTSTTFSLLFMYTYKVIKDLLAQGCIWLQTETGKFKTCSLQC